MSETYRNILGLRAIRSYQESPILQEDLDRVLEAARWTGSSRNLQKWAVVVVRNPDQIERLADCGDFTVPLRAAPVALALVQEPNTREFDTGRMAQNIMLAADALGMSTCPITLQRTEDTARVLGLPPGWTCRYAIALGYPAPGARPSRHGGRKPGEEIFHQESFSR
ncbi:MAG: nitroreductase family protein [bacterium]|nr:nitroreductase family protein [bacterium]MDE0602689.1 nitroreductase family protein [bacterium]